jgi:hypothetical protein
LIRSPFTNGVRGKRSAEALNNAGATNGMSSGTMFFVFGQMVNGEGGDYAMGLHTLGANLSRAAPSSFFMLSNFAQCLRPTANRLADERTYITPSDKAGVAISISPIEFVAM